ncbi:MAG: motility associated factor glycosyltransferase family protein [Rhodospirillales bacterium]
MPAQTLIERNKAFLARNVPELEPFLGLGFEQEVIDFYGADPADIVQAQLKAHRDRADRIVFQDPINANLSGVALGFAGAFADLVRAQGLDRVAREPLRDRGYGFVIGLGSGLHLEPLIAESDIRHLVIIEPVPALLGLALKSIDFTALAEIAERHDCRLHWIMDPEPPRAARRAVDLAARWGRVGLDGSFFFRHLPSWSHDQTSILLKERAKSLYRSAGYFEDECVMLRNGLANLTGHTFRLVRPQPLPVTPVPVAIVGSGPSLDRDLPHLKRLAPGTILFSAGSALGILLKNGIRPDCHFETENLPLTFDLFRDWSTAHGGFDGIRLVATTTLDPRAWDFFDQRWAFFRPALTSTVAFRAADLALDNADPAAANAALDIAIRAGFRTIYLFGTDLGARVGGAHHSADALYYDEAYEDVPVDSGFDRDVAANFGGRAMTSLLLDNQRRKLARAITACRDVAVFNTADGAAIEGAKPKAAGALRPATGEVDKPGLLTRIESHWAEVRAGSWPALQALQPDAESLSEFREAFRAFASGPALEEKRMTGVVGALARFAQSRPAEDATTLSLIQATLLNALRHANFTLQRVPDAGLALDLQRAMLDHWAALADKLLDGIQADILPLMGQALEAASRSKAG